MFLERSCFCLMVWDIYVKLSVMFWFLKNDYFFLFILNVYVKIIILIYKLINMKKCLKRNVCIKSFNVLIV